jgi:cytochrome P450
MSSWILHQDENYFPNARKFDPTRWLDPKEARRIEKAFVPFSKGTRACVGIKYVSFLFLRSLLADFVVLRIANYMLF